VFGAPVGVTTARHLNILCTTAEKGGLGVSDASQGAGWWQASDGKWYPPESRPGAAAAPPPHYGTPPPAKKRRGCLIGSLVGIGGLVILGVIAVVVVIVVLVVSGGDDKLGTGTEENPAAEDVTVTECTSGEPPLNYPEARGEITNHSSKASSYIFTISFEENGRRVAEGAVAQNNIQPDQTATWTATGSAQTTASIECKVPEVNRFATGRR
jgi:hypothetical protein